MKQFERYSSRVMNCMKAPDSTTRPMFKYVSATKAKYTACFVSLTGIGKRLESSKHFTTRATQSRVPILCPGNHQSCSTTSSRPPNPPHANLLLPPRTPIRYPAQILRPDIPTSFNPSHLSSFYDEIILPDRKRRIDRQQSTRVFPMAQVGRGHARSATNHNSAGPLQLVPFASLRQGDCGPEGLPGFVSRYGLRSPHQAHRQVRQGTEESPHGHRADSVRQNHAPSQPHSNPKSAGTQLGAFDHRTPHQDRSQLANDGTRQSGRCLYQELRNGSPADLSRSHLRTRRKEAVGGDYFSKGEVRRP